jgi:hypothetical protein
MTTPVSPSAPVAWRLVPVEPTEAMLEAGERAAWDDANIMPAIRAMPKAYCAMLAASPAPSIEGLREKVAEAVLDACRQYADTVRGYVGERRDTHVAYILKDATDSVLALLAREGV